MQNPAPDQRLRAANETLAQSRAAYTAISDRLGASDWDEAKDGPALEAAKVAYRSAELTVSRLTEDLATRAVFPMSAPSDGGGSAAPGVSVTPGKTPASMRDNPENARRSFRLLAAFDGLVNRDGNFSGIEAEMQQEGEKELRGMGLIGDGAGKMSLSIPSFLLGNGKSSLAERHQEARYLEHRGLERRDYLAETATAGGHLIQTDLGMLIPVLQPKLQVEAMGATVLRGLVGNLDLPRNDAYGSATWEGETDDAAETQATFDKVSLSPERLAAFSQVSTQAIRQAQNVDLENFTRRDLNNAVKRALDLAAINGSGSNDQPTGILNAVGVNDINIGTDGGPLDWALIVAFETALASDDADEGTLGFLTTPGVRGLLKTLKKDIAGNGFIWEKGMINDYMARVTNQMPSTLSKGASGSILHAMIFANWRELVIAQWGGVQMIVDPYSLKKKGMLEISINSYWDIALMHLQSFCICNEIDVS